MKEFRRYMKIARYGSETTEGIELGNVYVFPKIDGTNASVWFDGDTIRSGSRNRELSLDNDNAGFHAWVQEQENLKALFAEYPNLRLYGEWLVPHTLKTYRKDAWRNFYVFDVVYEGEGDNFYYLPYDTYKIILDKYDIQYAPPIAIIKNATADSLYHCLDKAGFLIEDGQGNGEGIVIKNYEYQNKFGDVVWAKIVTNEFKERQHKKMGAPEVVANKLIEGKIVEEFVTTALVDKEYAKIVNECGSWEPRYIPRLLNTIYYCLVTEEMWNIVKKHKNPTIDFKCLERLVILKTKELKREIF